MCGTGTRLSSRRHGRALLKFEHRRCPAAQSCEDSAIR